MDNRAKSALRLNRQKLTQGMALGPNFYAGCLETKTFTEEQIQRIKKEPTEESQISLMLDLLPKRGPDAFKNFLTLLRVDQSWLVDDIERTYKELCTKTKYPEAEKKEFVDKNYEYCQGSQAESADARLLCRVTVEVTATEKVQVEVKSTQQASADLHSIKLPPDEKVTNIEQWSNDKTVENHSVKYLQSSSTEKYENNEDGSEPPTQQESVITKQNYTEMCNKLIKSLGIDSNTYTKTLEELVDDGVAQLEKYKVEDQKCRKALSESDKQKPLDKCVKNLQDKKVQAMTNEQEALTKLFQAEQQLKEERKRGNIFEEELEQTKLLLKKATVQIEDISSDKENLKTELNELQSKFDKLTNEYDEQQKKSNIVGLTPPFPSRAPTTGTNASFHPNRRERNPALQMYQNRPQGRSKPSDKGSVNRKKYN